MLHTLNQNVPVRESSSQCPHDFFQQSVYLFAPVVYSNIISDYSVCLAKVNVYYALIVLWKLNQICPTNRCGHR